MTTLHFVAPLLLADNHDIAVARDQAIIHLKCAS